MDGWTDGRTNGWTDERDGWIDGWMDERRSNPTVLPVTNSLGDDHAYELNTRMHSLHVGVLITD